MLIAYVEEYLHAGLVTSVPLRPTGRWKLVQDKMFVEHEEFTFKFIFEITSKRWVSENSIVFKDHKITEAFDCAS